MICGIDFEGPLSPPEVRSLGYGSWIYAIYCGKGGGPKYVGQSSNLATRFICHPKHTQGDVIYVAAVPSGRRLSEERRLIKELSPPRNGAASRPKRPRHMLQTAGLNIRMTQAERDLINQVGGYEPGVWARGVLLNAARRILKGKGNQ